MKIQLLGNLNPKHTHRVVKQRDGKGLVLAVAVGSLPDGERGVG